MDETDKALWPGPTSPPADDGDGATASTEESGTGTTSEKDWPGPTVPDPDSTVTDPESGP
ncbi:MAG TPA: hypothetical protein VF163_06255 [Micromonosporaceae bacterium]